jgi:hypothetical protein
LVRSETRFLALGSAVEELKKVGGEPEEGLYGQFGFLQFKRLLESYHKAFAFNFCEKESQ